MNKELVKKANEQFVENMFNALDKLDLDILRYIVEHNRIPGTYYINEFFIESLKPNISLFDDEVIKELVSNGILYSAFDTYGITQPYKKLLIEKFEKNV